MRKLAIVSVLCLSFFPLSVFAQQVLRLRDGKTYNGTFVSGDASGVVFRDSSGVNRRFALNRIESIAFARATSAGVYDQRSTGVFGADRVGAEAEYVIPQGTDLSVRTDEAINSETATQGQTFDATIAQDVTDTSGQVVVPRGSPAQLVINEIEGGGVTGTPSVALDLRSVTVSGRTYLVDTADVEQKSDRGGLGANKRTATMVGGGAALGTRNRRDRRRRPGRGDWRGHRRGRRRNHSGAHARQGSQSAGGDYFDVPARPAAAAASRAVTSS